jgi:hypothetical protein
MQRRFIQLCHASRPAIAALTLCAITATSSPALADTATLVAGATSLLGADDREELGPSGAPSFEDGDAAATSLGATAPIASTFGPARAPLALTLPAIGAAHATKPVAALPPAAPEENDGAGLRTAGYIAGGVGLVGLALFAIAGLGAKSTYDKLDADCGETPCTDEAHRSDIAGGRMLQTAANLGLAAGVAGLGVGATLLVLGNRGAESRPASPSVSAHGAMITYGGQF